MLKAKPTKWWSSNQSVFEDDREIAQIKVAGLREAGSFELDGVRYELKREPGWGDFTLCRDGDVICRANKPSALRRSFTIGLADNDVVLRAASGFSRRFILEVGGQTAGEVRPGGFFRGMTEIEFPDAVDRPVQVFLFWLVLIMWRREDDAPTPTVVGG